MPIDYVECVTNPYISNDLIQILSKPKSWQWCMLRTPLKRIERSSKVLIQFHFMIISNWVLLWLTLYPYEYIALFITHMVFTIALLFVSTILSVKDPGYIAKDNTMDFLALLETKSLDKLCPICEIATYPKIKHWRIWNKCIEGYDHHCPWINNCIGAKNHNIFMLYLVLLIWFLLFNITIWIYNVSSVNLLEKTNFLLIPAVDQFLSDHEYLYRLVLIFNIIVCFFALLLNSYVLYLQIGNYMNNATTYERFSNEGIALRKKLAKYRKSVILKKQHSESSSSSKYFFFEKKTKRDGINTSEQIEGKIGISRKQLIEREGRHAW